MAGYVKGSQAWYDHARSRVVELSMKMRSKEMTQEERDKIYYGEYKRLIHDLNVYWHEGLVNNPI